MTVLQASGADVSLQELVDKVYIPVRKGSLQVEMLAATRTSGRIPYRLDGTLAALLAELQAGRPIVVLQNLGVTAFPRWHFAVVIGIDADGQDVILRSGTDERRVTPFRTFLHTWRRSDYWAFVALQPGELPPRVDRRRYLAAIAGFEQAGNPGRAMAAWAGALERWPGDQVALFGYANALYANGSWDDAARAYESLLALNSDLAVARNNLAMALLRLGRPDQALVQIDAALRDVEDPQLRAEFGRTRETIRKSLKTR